MKFELDYKQCEELEHKVFLDVRSPSEYREDHLPNAENMPLFSDEERAIVGTIYKKEGSFPALIKGIDLVSPKLKDFVIKIQELKKKYNYVIIYCWRGGMRSKALANWLNGLNMPVFRLIGGYKSYRTMVCNFFERDFFREKKAILLYGYTGAGKTYILQELKKSGYPIINLEELANHRGSFFGDLGLEQISQKKFENNLYQEFQKISNKKYFFIECESRKIGNISLPNVLFDVMKKGINILIDVEQSVRIENLIEEYGVFWHQAAMDKKIELLKMHLSKTAYENLQYLYKTAEMEEFTRFLLESYYDQKYSKDSKITFAKTLQINNKNDYLSTITELQNIYSMLEK